MISKLEKAEKEVRTWPRYILSILCVSAVNKRPKSMRVPLTIVAILLSISGLCCINDYRTLINGKKEFFDMPTFIPYATVSLEDTVWRKNSLREADSLFRQTGRMVDYSDYGVELIYSNRLVEAKKVFQEIERQHPMLYATAANLGTAYELLGQSDSALYWIKKAVAINPSSHDSSEWIHVKILEAKIAAKNAPDYFLKNSILDIDFGEELIPDTTKLHRLDDLRNQLLFQLSERISFVKPQDPVVGQLLFDLGNICAVTVDVESAIENYKLAREYGFTSAVMDKREKYFETLRVDADGKVAKEADSNKRVSISRRRPDWHIVIPGTILALAGVFYVARRRKSRDA